MLQGKGSSKHANIKLKYKSEISHEFLTQYIPVSFPGGSDQSLLQKFNDNHGNHENYNKTQIQENAFEIRHYAGPVQYKIDVRSLTVLLYKKLIKLI